VNLASAAIHPSIRGLRTTEQAPVRLRPPNRRRSAPAAARAARTQRGPL